MDFNPDVRARIGTGSEGTPAKGPNKAKSSKAVIYSAKDVKQKTSDQFKISTVSTLAALKSKLGLAGRCVNLTLNEGGKTTTVKVKAKNIIGKFGITEEDLNTAVRKNTVDTLIRNKINDQLKRKADSGPLESQREVALGPLEMLASKNENLAQLVKSKDQGIAKARTAVDELAAKGDPIAISAKAEMDDGDPTKRVQSWMRAAEIQNPVALVKFGQILHEMDAEAFKTMDLGKLIILKKIGSDPKQLGTELMKEGKRRMESDLAKGDPFSYLAMARVEDDDNLWGVLAEKKHIPEAMIEYGTRLQEQALGKSISNESTSIIEEMTSVYSKSSKEEADSTFDKKTKTLKDKAQKGDPQAIFDYGHLLVECGKLSFDAEIKREGEQK